MKCKKYCRCDKCFDAKDEGDLAVLLNEQNDPYA